MEPTRVDKAIVLGTRAYEMCVIIIQVSCVHKAQRHLVAEANYIMKVLLLLILW